MNAKEMLQMRLDASVEFDRKFERHYGFHLEDPYLAEKIKTHLQKILLENIKFLQGEVDAIIVTYPNQIFQAIARILRLHVLSGDLKIRLVRTLHTYESVP
jgi:hypothetical protein